jgi:TonB family protein
MLRKQIAILGTGVALALLPLSAAIAADTPAHIDTSGVNMQPAYPSSAFIQQEKGNVVVRAHVREDGKVSSVEIQHSSNFDDLDSAAANTVLNWKFVPAMEDGHPASSIVSVQLVFVPPVDGAAPAQSASH